MSSSSIMVPAASRLFVESTEDVSNDSACVEVWRNESFGDSKVLVELPFALRFDLFSPGLTTSLFENEAISKTSNELSSVMGGFFVGRTFLNNCFVVMVSFDATHLSSSLLP